MCVPCFKFVLFFRIFQARDGKGEASEKRGTRATGKAPSSILKASIARKREKSNDCSVG